MADDLAIIKRQKLGPSGDHATYSVFYQQQVEDGVREITAAMEPSGDAVADAGKYTAHSTEGRLVAEMTPVLEHVLRGDTPGLVISNTEEIKWIPAGGGASNMQKCDLVLLLDGLQSPHIATGSQELQNYRSQLDTSFDYKFGAPVYQIREFISGIVEYKLNGINNSAKGELASYLKHLSADDDPNTYVGLVCDREKYSVTSCRHGRLGDFESGDWSTPGSANLLHQRFSRRNRWLQLLLGLCDQMQVSLCPEANKSAFLGRGGYGVVFRVKSLSSGEVFALKVVLYSQGTASIKTLLPSEHAMLTELNGKFVISVAGGLVTVLDNGEELGAGYLMSEVGRQIAVEDCVTSGKICSLSALGSAVFMALRGLHACGRSHGDARIANIVLIGETVKWIDMMHSVSSTEAAKRVFDIKTLLESLLRNKPDAADLLMRANVVSAYGADCSVENMQQLCKAVEAALNAVVPAGAGGGPSEG